MSKFSNETLNPGEHFIYNGIEFICLDIIDGNYLAMTAKACAEIPFDTNGKNDWRKSSLRRVLNNDFLDLLNRRHLIKQTSDLIAENGDKAYGTSEDYVTILSCDQYRKYREIVPLFEEWMWTLTPWSCTPSDSNYVRSVNTMGNVINCDEVSNIGVAPVCLFSSENLKLRRQARLIGVDEDDSTKSIREAKCVECGEPIGDELYHFTKRRYYAPVFIHKRCYEKLLPKKGK